MALSDETRIIKSDLRDLRILMFGNFDLLCFSKKNQDFAELLGRSLLNTDTTSNLDDLISRAIDLDVPEAGRKFLIKNANDDAALSTSTRSSGGSPVKPYTKG